jgi:hypothetical protein
VFKGNGVAVYKCPEGGVTVMDELKLLLYMLGAGLEIEGTSLIVARPTPLSISSSDSSADDSA